MFVCTWDRVAFVDEGEEMGFALVVIRGRRLREREEGNWGSAEGYAMDARKA